MADDYRVEILPSAKRELVSLPHQTCVRAASVISGLHTNPRPRGCKKLQGSDSDYRARVGEYLILYEVDDAKRFVQVYRIRHRSRAYR